MHSSTLLTKPNRKERQVLSASHCAWHSAAVVMPVGCEIGVWLSLPAGALPQVLRTESLAVLAPVGFFAVGTTAGTEVQALS